jgi:hypothetical protein
MPHYVQMLYEGKRETVEEADDVREARRLRDAHQRSNPAAYYYTSNRACKAWRDEVIAAQAEKDALAND